MHIVGYFFKTAAGLVVLLAAAAFAQAQQVQQVEAKFTVTSSNVQGIATGQIIRLNAQKPETKLAFPTFVKVRLSATTLDIQSSFYVAVGRASSSSIAGIQVNDAVDCRINFATVNCTVSRQGQEIPQQFRGTILRLHAVTE
ncbi:MAG TPA: hypothetical protein VFV34_01675 [Blastocatellia bacterium]|nr:hypothetical protein [Blastocatellia bacterium]